MRTFQKLCFLLLVSTQALSNNLFSKTELCKLLTLTNLPCDKAPQKIVDSTQKNWLRPAGKERWEVEEKFSDKRVEILKLLDSLGFSKEVRPNKKHYDYVLIFGALSPSMKKRMSFLVKEWQKGLRFKQIFFLVGERARNFEMEPEKTLLESDRFLKFPKNVPALKHSPQTETEMAKLIYEHAILPDGFRKIPMIFISAPQKIEKGKTVRPTTSDTIQHLLSIQKMEANATILAISNQPFVSYQHAVLEGAFPKKENLHIETVGYEADKNTNISVYLDSLARTLYNQLQTIDRN